MGAAPGILLVSLRNQVLYASGFTDQSKIILVFNNRAAHLGEMKWLKVHSGVVEYNIVCHIF